MIIWQKGNLRIERLVDNDAQKHFDEFARLRIEVFREYPYLYDGCVENEKSYLQTYLSCAEAGIFVLFDKDKICGMLTTLPMAQENPQMLAPLKLTQISPSDCLYLGDMILEKSYRGLGLFPHFLNAAENLKNELHLEKLLLMTICTTNLDAMRPPNFKDIDTLCTKYGFAKIDGCTIDLKWNSIALAGKEKNHRLQFYIR